MALPKIGVKVVVENIPAFNKAIDDVNKKIKGAGDNTEDTAKKTNIFEKALDKAGISLKDIQGKIKDVLGQAGPLGSFLGGFVDKLAAIPLPAAAAVAGIAFLAKAFLDLGQRGAGLIGLAQTFDNVTASVGVTSQTLLKDLRAASAGTISDFALIEKANIALSGATGKLGVELGQKLPKLLEIARVQAKATGKDIDFIFNSLVEGVRKSSPLRIDNAQLIIKVTDAEKQYAATIGKTVEQLTVEEKGIAILNATIEAGNAALAQAGNVQETNAEKIARANATITNALDGLAVAVQPAYGTLLDAQQKVLDIFKQLADAIGPIFGAIMQIITSVIGTIISVVTSIVQPIIDAFSSIAPYIALVFQFIADIVGKVGKVIGDVVGGIVKFLSDVGKNLFGLDLKTLGPQLFNGAAAAFGSFANGIIAVANKLIFPAVIGIAKFIADFLIGFSPPKKGPLSVIDQGGANVMSSWLDGFTGVSLDPVKVVAQQVTDALGAIGSQSLNTVNKRLAQLDKALLPFQNRLDIVKATFESINEPAKAALDAIDRETDSLQAAVAAGDTNALERLRILDQQRDVIQSQVDAQQGIVDAAQIQFALAKAQQAPERALLMIRKAYLDALAKRQGKGKKAPSAGGTSPAGAGGAGAPAPTLPTGGITAGTGGEMPSVLDMIGGQGAVDAAAAGLSDAFMGAIDQSGLTEFAQNELDLGSQIDRIKGVDLGKKIGDKFKGLSDAFNPDVEGSIANQVRGFVQTLTGDENTPGSVASFFANMGTNVQTAAAGVLATVSGALNSVFDPNTEGSAVAQIIGVVSTLTGGSDTEGSIASFFAALPQNVSDAASHLLDDLKTYVFDPVKNFLIGSEPGSISDIINQFIALVGGMPALFVQALQNFGGMIYNAIVVPIINVMNAGISAVESGIRNIASFFASFLGQIITSFDTTEVAGTNLGGLVPQALRDFQAGLASVGSSFTIGRISTELPSFLQPPGGATGGLFSGGLMRVGERGSELVYNATKTGVIPHDLTRVLTDLSTILAQPQALPLMGGNTYNDSNSNMTNNFYGVQGASDVMKRFSMLQARS